MKFRIIIALFICLSFVANTQTLNFDNFDLQMTLEKQGNQYINKATQQKLTIAN